jgi:hypothetical protein
MRNGLEVIIQLVHKLTMSRHCMSFDNERVLLTGAPVGIFNSEITSSGMLSRYFTRARKEFPCAAMITFFPDLVNGFILASFKYGSSLLDVGDNSAVPIGQHSLQGGLPEYIRQISVPSTATLSTFRLSVLISHAPGMCIYFASFPG